MSEMVERVAKAIEAVVLNSLVPGEAFNPEACARAAIAAMREPTEAMLTAAQAHKGQQSYTDVWQAMIDEALR